MLLNHANIGALTHVVKFPETDPSLRDSLRPPSAEGARAARGGFPRPTRGERISSHFIFSGDEIPFEADGNLSLARDPKSAWAQAHPERFPLEVNRAEPELLLRVPGIGPTTAKRIVAERRTGTIRFLDDLRRLGAQADHAAPYLTFDGHAGARQLTLLYQGRPIVEVPPHDPTRDRS